MNVIEKNCGKYGHTYDPNFRKNYSEATHKLMAEYYRKFHKCLMKQLISLSDLCSIFEQCVLVTTLKC